MSVTATKDLKNALQVPHAPLSWVSLSQPPALIYGPSAVCGGV